MRRLLIVAALCTAFFVSAVSFAESEEGYTFISTDRGTQICLGRWVPPRTVGLAGTCEGQIMSFPQLSAVSTKQTVDRLDQLILTLQAIDQKMGQNNDQLGRLLDATVNTQNSIDTQVRQFSAFLRETIIQRFDALPEELLANETFREELTKLKEEILADIEKRFPARQAPPAK